MMNITVGRYKCNHEISIVMMNITVGHYKCEPRNKYSNDEHYRRSL